MYLWTFLDKFQLWHRSILINHFHIKLSFCFHCRIFELCEVWKASLHRDVGTWLICFVCWSTFGSDEGDWLWLPRGLGWLTQGTEEMGCSRCLCWHGDHGTDLSGDQSHCAGVRGERWRRFGELNTNVQVTERHLRHPYMGHDLQIFL